MFLPTIHAQVPPSIPVPNGCRELVDSADHENALWKDPLAGELPERDANRCILVRGCKPVFVLLCDAKELLHLLRSWRCGRSVRIEWPCELAEEAVEFLLAHDD